ncbi:MAG TPA: outer membrane protein transport protein [Thermoanaerobaculia bacterium]|nr:outer membrane protein transport protein [Thermoanaerobaculia bacterium]
MRHSRFVVWLITAAALAAPPGAAHAGSFGNFQHGGRGTGEAGALTARADDPSALSYNPAGITALPGFQLQLGLDFNAGEGKYSSSSGTFADHHVINFPPAFYATWRLKDSPFAFGLGVDSPLWSIEDWRPTLFPGRFLNRRLDLQVGELHPVVAYDLGGGWSVGGGLRYAYANLRQGDNRITGGPVTLRQGDKLGVEFERDATAKIDALSWDLGVRYADPAWGWGVVYRSDSKMKGSGTVRYSAHTAPGVGGAGPFPDGRSDQAFEIPWEARAGVWVAPYPELRLELDLAHQNWSALQATSVTYTPNPVEAFPAVSTPRNWKDTDSLRLGIEGEVTNLWTLYGGIAYEKTPVPTSTLEPNFPRGDAIVYSFGFSINYPRISLDAGASYYSHRSRRADNQELLNPGVSGTYSADDRVWGGAIRWRF